MKTLLPSHLIYLRSSVLFGLCIALLAGCGECGEGKGSGGTLSGEDVGSDVTVGGDDVGDLDANEPDGISDQDTRDVQDDVGETCAPENRCAELCCASDQLCLRDQCVL